MTSNDQGWGDSKRFLKYLICLAVYIIERMIRYSYNELSDEKMYLKFSNWGNFTIKFSFIFRFWAEEQDRQGYSGDVLQRDDVSSPRSLVYESKH